MAKEICEPKGEIVKEHERLVKTLRTGSKKELRAEAKDQSGELSKYRKGGRKVVRGTNRR
jgi:hypothetical protein